MDVKLAPPAHCTPTRVHCGGCGNPNGERLTNKHVGELFADRGKTGNGSYDLVVLEAAKYELCVSCIQLVMERREFGETLSRRMVAACSAVQICVACGIHQSKCRCADPRRIEVLNEREIDELRIRIAVLERDLADASAQRVYVLRSCRDRSIAKIGKGNSPADRARYWARRCKHDLEIVGCTAGGLQTESRLHNEFRQYRLDVPWGKEFFRWSPRLETYIHEHFDQLGPVGEIVKAAP